MPEQPRKTEPSLLSAEKAARKRFKETWANAPSKEEHEERLRAALGNASPEQLKKLLAKTELEIARLSSEWNAFEKSDAAIYYDESLDVMIKREGLTAEMKRATELFDLLDAELKEREAKESAA